MTAQSCMLAACIAQEQAASPAYIKLMKFQISTVLVVANLAGKLRLTPRSSKDRYQPRLAPSGPKPWELDDEAS